ncbi:hypothetical protein RND71_035252 [Anisodus tanguticus]|uniref:Uncharacterized protein n=1 Tax=Anisodus tanguticus TaxID=243964 RepID=A0AAE1R4L7_9SOLA|nr:hypothetical protein RND71_035252 [Anisodus tanguticus]
MRSRSNSRNIASGSTLNVNPDGDIGSNLEAGFFEDDHEDHNEETPAVVEEAP